MDCWRTTFVLGLACIIIHPRPLAMAPASRKGGSASKASRERRSASRHSSPVSALTDTTPSTPLTGNSATTAPTLPRDTPYLHAPTAVLISPSESSLETLIDKAGAAVPATKAGDPPTSKELHTLHDRIQDSLLKSIAKRGEACERYLRSVVQKRKERAQADREREAAEHAAVAAAKAAKAERNAEADGAKKQKKAGRKRSRDEMMDEHGPDKAEERREREGVPSAVGAHGVARQDGVRVHDGKSQCTVNVRMARSPEMVILTRSHGTGEPPPAPSPPVEQGTATLDPMDTRPSTPSSNDSPLEPAPTAPLYERAFGKDPSTCPDPTVYDIRPLYPEMADDDKQKILNVANWPQSDLKDLTAGDPPDMDFSNAKPANQVHFTTFQTHIEPYIRPFTEEDVAFLKERGDRVLPYVIPARGPRTHKEVWAAEDGLTGIEAPRRDEADPNTARGSMDDMNDEVAETDECSMGPVMNRLMALTRPQPNGRGSGAGAGAEDSGPQDQLNGDSVMTNGIDAIDGLDGGLPNGIGEESALQTQNLRPAAALPLDAPRLASLPLPDYDTFEYRALQELKYIGFLTPNDTPSFAAHNDDEVAARLRTLQAELRQVSQRNNVRKARVLEMAEERMAMQEYSNIADDLDNQVNAAYLKRNRSLAKPSSKKGGQAQARSGQRGVATGLVGARGVSEGVRQLMQKRKDWIDMVGPVVGYGRAPIVGDGETVFDPESLRRLEALERETEAEGAEGD